MQPYVELNDWTHDKEALQNISQLSSQTQWFQVALLEKEERQCVNSQANFPPDAMSAHMLIMCKHTTHAHIIHAHTQHICTHPTHIYTQHKHTIRVRTLLSTYLCKYTLIRAPTIYGNIRLLFIYCYSIIDDARIHPTVAQGDIGDQQLPQWAIEGNRYHVGDGPTHITLGRGRETHSPAVHRHHASNRHVGGHYFALCDLIVHCRGVCVGGGGEAYTVTPKRYDLTKFDNHNTPWVDLICHGRLNI